MSSGLPIDSIHLQVSAGFENNCDDPHNFLDPTDLHLPRLTQVVAGKQLQAFLHIRSIPQVGSNAGICESEVWIRIQDKPL